MIAQTDITAYIDNIAPVAQEVYHSLVARTSTMKVAALQAPVLTMIIKALDGMPQMQAIQILPAEEKEKKVIKFVFEDLTLSELVEALEVTSRKDAQRPINQIGFLRNIAFKAYGKMVGISGKDLLRLRRENYSAYLQVGDALVLAGLVKYQEGYWVHSKSTQVA